MDNQKIKKEMIKLKRIISNQKESLEELDEELNKIEENLLTHKISHILKDDNIHLLFNYREAYLSGIKALDQQIEELNEKYNTNKHRLYKYTNEYNKYKNLPIYKKIFKMFKMIKLKRIINDRVYKHNSITELLEEKNNYLKAYINNYNHSNNTIINTLLNNGITNEELNKYLNKSEYIDKNINLENKLLNKYLDKDNYKNNLIINKYLRMKDVVVNKKYLLNKKDVLINELDNLKISISYWQKQLDLYKMQYALHSNTIDKTSKLKEEIINNEYPNESLFIPNPGSNQEKYNRMSELNKMKRKDLKKIVKEAK